LEICAIELETEPSEIFILSLYTAQHRKNYKQLTIKRDDILEHLYKPTAGLLICGDINTDYLTESKLGGGTSLIINNI